MLVVLVHSQLSEDLDCPNSGGTTEELLTI